MAEKTYRLLRPLSRRVVDNEGKSQVVRLGAGEVITPTESELQAFGDLMEAASAPAPAAAAEEPRRRS
jgi:hypothetical protein